MRCSSSWLRVAPIGLPRRFGAAALGIALAALLFRGYIALVLVNRGDDLLRAGDDGAARRYYDRATFFDPGWDVPADRFAFSASLSGDPRALAAGVLVATRVLARRESAALRWDRAMCLLHLGRKAEAFSDLRALARMRRDDWRLNDMAKNIALQLGRRDAAREFVAWSKPRR